MQNHTTELTELDLEQIAGGKDASDLLDGGMSLFNAAGGGGKGSGKGSGSKTSGQKKTGKSSGKKR